MPISSTSRDPFELITENSSRDPHRFKAYRYDRTHGDCWREVVEGCLESWRIKAEAFYERLPETGFKPIGLNRILSNYGRTQLPPTPLEDHTVTKEPAITDMTEVLALKVLEWKEQELVLPYPRVLHKESFKLQHHGIDALGYREDPEGYYTLYVIEIMASVENNHPPVTVKRHLNQILPETLNAPDPERLLQDLQTVHDESSDEHRSILNGFIIATLDGALSSTDSVMATPILIRRHGEFHENDWTPFLKGTALFEQAQIPSTVYFVAVECHDSFSGMLDLIKQTASAFNESEIENGEDK